MDQSAKNPAAVALGKLGAAKTTREQRSAGGKARAAAMTARQRSESARKAALARHSRKSGGK